MANGSHEEAGKEPVEELIDDLIRDIMKESGSAPKEAAYEQDPLSAALVEAAMSSLYRPVSQASPFERMLLSQAIATALADSLAPALARVLAPEIMKALGHVSESHETGGEQPRATSSAKRTDKPASR